MLAENRLFRICTCKDTFIKDKVIQHITLYKLLNNEANICYLELIYKLYFIKKKAPLVEDGPYEVLTL